MILRVWSAAVAAILFVVRSKKRRIDQIKIYSALLSPCSKKLQKSNKNPRTKRCSFREKKLQSQPKSTFPPLQLKKIKIFTAPVAFKKPLF
jgi:hypothetical protein